MTANSSEQAKTIAKSLSECANAVGRYRRAAPGLSDQDVDRLSDLESSLRRASTRCLNGGLDNILDGLEEHVQGLGAVTAQLKEKLVTQTKILNAVQIVDALAKLATGFISADPQQITASLASALTTLKSLSA